MLSLRKEDFSSFVQSCRTPSNTVRLRGLRSKPCVSAFRSDGVESQCSGPSLTDQRVKPAAPLAFDALAQQACDIGSGQALPYLLLRSSICTAAEQMWPIAKRTEDDNSIEAHKRRCCNPGTGSCRQTTPGPRTTCWDHPKTPRCY